VTTAARAGVGLGLRWDFLEELLAQPDVHPGLDLVEVSPENYMGRGGHYRALLDRAAARWPVLTHGLTMSLGGADPLDAVYLRDLGDFVRAYGSPHHSDHLCFGASGGRVLHDLLPVAFTEATVARVADRVRRAQDALGVPVAVENISFYAHPGRRDMGEAEFLAQVCDRAGCGLLLDVNNAFVNATNFGLDVDAWMRTAPLERTVQIHVAGHEPHEDGFLLDTHGADVPDPVLALLERVLPRTGAVPVVLERDTNVPPLGALLAEVAAVRAVYARALPGAM